MDRKIEKAIKEAESSSRELILEFINILNSAEPTAEAYEKAFDRWAEARFELEKLSLSIGIGEFQFKYSVYEKTQKIQQEEKDKKLLLTGQDNKLLRSLKIIPPGEEPKDEQ